MKKLWDPSKSPSKNLEGMGLRAQPNDTRPSPQTEQSKNGTMIELFDVPDSDTAGKRAKRFPLNLDDERYIADCMAKWGDDYKSMFRDIQTNNLQHTEEKLKKMGARYILLTPEQRRVEVPDKVRKLLPSSYSG